MFTINSCEELIKNSEAVINNVTDDLNTKSSLGSSVNNFINSVHSQK